MKKITGNEPAMPINEAEKDRLDTNPNISYTGLTIHQQFAMAAMQALLSNMPKTHMDDALPMISKQSVRFADALINELNK